jgi:hypothetical protein
MSSEEKYLSVQTDAKYNGKTLNCVCGMYIVDMRMHLISTVRKNLLWFEWLQATTSRCNELFTRSEIEHSMSETGGVSKITQRAR